MANSDLTKKRVPNPTGKGGVKFQKGVSGNPSGKPRQDPTIRAFKETTYKDFITHLQRYGSFSAAEMKADLERPDATMFELIFGKIIAQAAAGEKDGRQVLLERLWGKVKEEVRLEQSNPIKEAMSQLSAEELLKLIRSEDEE